MTAPHPPGRILMTADAVGGVWDYALELAAGLAEGGTEVVLAVLGPPPDAGRRQAAQALPGLRLHEFGGRLEWMERCEDDLRASGERLLTLARRVRPDIVHVNGYAQAALPFDAPVLAVAHSCVLSWWRAVHGEDAPASWDAYARRAAAGLAAADRVAAPTRAMLDAAARHYGPLPHGRVVPNGRAPGRYGPRTKQPVILSAGRVWDAAKNIAALDAVAPRLDWPVVVAGSLGHPDGTERKLAHARWLGHLPAGELAAWMGCASVFALPARYEPFGLSALEAALSGCALVLGDIPSLRELWEGAALFVPPDDPALLEAALNRVARDAGLRQRLAAAALGRARTYTAGRMVRGYRDLYAELLGADAAHSPIPTTLSC